VSRGRGSPASLGDALSWFCIVMHTEFIWALLAWMRFFALRESTRLRARILHTSS
jgi:hypothetical protein